MQPKKIHWKTAIVPGIGVVLAAIGAALAICWDDIFHAILAKQLALSPTSRAYAVWKETPGPLYFDIYFFNWTNPEDINDHSTKPYLVEMGPYRFRETREKVNVTWHEENSTVSYRQLRRWYFDEEGSIGSLDDNITTLNVVAASAIYASRKWNFMKQKAISVGLAIFHQTVSVTKTAGELLFDGYDDPLIDLAKSFPQMETNAPPVDKFGWFYNRNGSVDNDGYFNVATGAANISEIGVAKKWNNATTTPFFPGGCGKVEGSAGEFYPPKLTKSDKVSLFSADLCRTISFDYDEEIEVKGIRALKYSGGSSIMDNGTIHEENRCYCQDECQPSGLLNVSTCRYGSPAFISFPHFYQADQYYLDAVEGLSPDKEKHNFFMAFEPTAAVPVEVAARFQLNILISPRHSIELYRRVPHLYLPVLWFEQHVTLGDEFADQIQMMLKVPMIGHVVALIIFTAGILVFLWTPIKINLVSFRKGGGKRGESVDSENGKQSVVLNNVIKEREALMGGGSKDPTKHAGDSVMEPLTTIRNKTKE